MQCDIAIVGAGPAGLAAAHAVVAARPNTRVAVLERSDVRPRGAMVFLPPNGVRAIEAIGGPALKQALAQHHSTHLKTRSFSPAGELVSSSDDGGAVAKLQAADGGERIFLPWHDVQRELADALPAQAQLHTRHRFVRYADSGDGVEAEFEGPDGQLLRVQAALLIGTDGGQSAVRQELLGDGPPSFLGMAIWRAVRPRPADWPVDVGYVGFGAPGQPTCMTHTIGDGSLLAWNAFARWPAERLHEIGGGRRAYVQDGAAVAEAGSDAAAQGPSGRVQRALAAFDSYPQLLKDLIATTDPDAIIEHGQFCREPERCQVYAKGRVALLGDAAHLATPFLGQGCSQAFEDAWALGRAVGKHGATPEALQAYQAVRVPLAGAVQEASLTMFRNMMSGQRDKSEYEVNAELGFTRRQFEALRAVAGVPN